MRILFAAAEIAPLAKTGGLGDVCAALPAALARLGADVRLMMPGYESALDRARGKRAAVPLGDVLGLGETRLVPARTPDTGLPLWLVDCPARFRRRGGPYADADGQDWSDNALRFGLFSHVIARAGGEIESLRWRPDVVHLHDWHTSLAAPLIAAWTGARPGVVLTLHNMSFQGLYPASLLAPLCLPKAWFTPDGIEFYGRLSFLKAGIRFADRLTTVSPRYAREIRTPQFGCGLDGLLRARADVLTGILNGMDYIAWDPADRAQVVTPYNAHDLWGKQRCKIALETEFGLAVDEGAPLIVYLSRLTRQKMADMLPEIAQAVRQAGARLIICGQGDGTIEQSVRAVAARYPEQIALHVGYDEALARRLLSGADILAAPARFEPCGLTHLYAMRFGAIPIVRHVGGLADTIIPWLEQTRSLATGFVFHEPTPAGVREAIEQACAVYRDAEAWQAMRLRAMDQDFGWGKSAARYLALYEDLLAEQAARWVGVTAAQGDEP